MSKEPKRWRLEDFDKFDEVGRGKFGVIFHAKERISQVDVALKMIPKTHYSSHEQMKNQLKREVEVHCRCKHRNICQMHGWFQDQNNIYLVLEYCQMGSLFVQLKVQKKILTLEEIIDYMRQLSLAMAYLHERSIIHRDVKLENVLVAKDGLKITDFGWCIHSIVQQRNTLCGTLEYLSPQMVKKESHDSSLDVYSLGVLFYELFCDRTPYYDDCEDMIYEKIVEADLMFDESVREVPLGAKDLIRRMMVSNKKERLDIKQVMKHPFLSEPFPLPTPE